MRIVSLLPAATEIVHALGLQDALVGRSHECDHPAAVAALPALTRARVDSSLPSAELDLAVVEIVRAGLPLYMLDEARLAALAPDVVVTQAACEVCAIAYDQVRSALQRTAPGATLVSLQPRRLTDVLDDVIEVARACGVGERGAAVVRGLTDRLDAVAAAPLAPRPRVAVVEWLAPLMLAGHWVPDVIERAGGTPVGPAAGTPSPYASWDELRALEPDALVVAPCGFDLERTLAESVAAAEFLRSVCDRVLFLDGNVYLNRPGPRLVEAVETIGGWLRGLEPSPDRGRAGWSALAAAAQA